MSRRRLVAAVLLSSHLAGGRLAAATPPTNVPAPEGAGAGGAKETEAQIRGKIEKFDLPDTTMLDQAKKKKLTQKAFAADPKLLKPYAGASLGPRIAYSIVDHHSIVSAPVAQKIVEQTIDRLLAAWNGPDGPHPDIQIAIVAKSGYAAEATEQGVMFVPLGVFDKDPTKGVASNDELALLIGHELSHYLLRHIDHSAMRRAIVNKIATAASAWVTYGAVKKSSMDDNGRMTIAADPATVRRAHLVGLATTTLIGDLLNPGFARHDEIEADLLAIDLARKAHYDISESEIDNFITHHTADQAAKSERMARLQALVQYASIELGTKMGQKSGNLFGIDFSTLVSAASAKLIGSAFDELAKSKKEHPDPTIRLGIMKRYFAKVSTAAAEDDGQLVRKDTQRIDALHQAGPVTQTIVNLRRAEDEYLALELEAGKTGQPAASASGGALGGAAKITDGIDTQAAAKVAAVTGGGVPPKRGGGKAGRGAAKHGPTTARASVGRSPLGSDIEDYSWFVEGAIQAFRLSNAAQARASWLRSVGGDYPSIEGVHYLGNAYVQAGMRGNLVPVVDRLSKELGSTDPIIDLAVGAAMAREDVAGAEVLAARCLNLEGGQYYAYCTEQLGYDPLQKDVGAKTPEGQKAFSGKSLEKQFSVFSTITSLFK